MDLLWPSETTWGVLGHSSSGQTSTLDNGTAQLRSLQENFTHFINSSIGFWTCNQRRRKIGAFWSFHVLHTCVNRQGTRRACPCNWTWVAALPPPPAAHPPPSDLLWDTAFITTLYKTREKMNPKGDSSSSYFSGGDAQRTMLQTALFLQKDCLAGTSFCARLPLQRDDKTQNPRKVRGCLSSREAQIQNHFNLLLTQDRAITVYFLAEQLLNDSKQFMGIFIVSVTDTGEKQFLFLPADAESLQYIVCINQLTHGIVFDTVSISVLAI